MADGKLDVVARLRADNKEFDSAMEDSEQSLFSFNKAGLAAGAALVGLGAGLAKVTNRARDIDLDFARLAASSGQTEDSLKGLAKELSNVTFTQDDVAEGMAVLIKRGITTRDEMEQLLPIADRYADAWGVDMTKATTTLIDTMKVFGSEVGDAEKDLDTVAFLTQRTSGEFNRLERQIRTNQAEFDGLGLSLEDSVAALRALEASGRSGDTAMRVFGDAIMDSEGNADAFWSSLGVGEDAIQSARDEMQEFEGATLQAAESYAESKTLWDKFMFSLDEGAIGIGRVLTPMRDMAPVMQTAGSAALIMSSINFKAVVPSLIATATAGWAAIAPFLPLVLAIGAAIAIGVLLFKNWDTIKSFAIEAWGAIKEFVVGAVKGLTQLFLKWHPAGILISKWDEIKEVFTGAWTRFKSFGADMMKGLAQGVLDFASAPVDAVKGAGKKILDGVKGVFKIGSPSKIFSGIGTNVMQSMARGVAAAAKDPVGAMKTAGERMVGGARDALSDVPTGSLQSRALQAAGLDGSEGVLGGIRRLLERLEDAGDAEVLLDGRLVGRALKDATGRRITRWKVTD